MVRESRTTRTGRQGESSDCTCPTPSIEHRASEHRASSSELRAPNSELRPPRTSSPPVRGVAGLRGAFELLSTRAVHAYGVRSTSAHTRASLLDPRAAVSGDAPRTKHAHEARGTRVRAPATRPTTHRSLATGGRVLAGRSELGVRSSEFESSARHPHSPGTRQSPATGGRVPAGRSELGVRSSELGVRIERPIPAAAQQPAEAHQPAAGCRRGGRSSEFGVRSSELERPPLSAARQPTEARQPTAARQPTEARQPAAARQPARLPVNRPRTCPPPRRICSARRR